MRRMYSEQELTKIVKNVLEDAIADGDLDQAISDAVDAYLVEHPVDITALEGKTIAPAVVNASTSMSAPSGSFTALNGESNPSVKPIYWHGIEINNSNNSINLTMVFLTNSSTAINDTTKLKTLIESFPNQSFINLDGIYHDGTHDTQNCYGLYKANNHFYEIIGADNSNGRMVYQINDTIDALLNLITRVQDRVNKIN